MTLVWQPGWNRIMEPEAVNFISAVNTADAAAGSPGGLEFGMAVTFNDFISGCKSDGIWDAIKACCILAGARTLAGALVPLVGTAPTSFNFVDADYDRKTGLKGDASTKYLNSNRSNTADPQDSQHLSVYLTEVPPLSTLQAYIGTRDGISGVSMLVHRSFSNRHAFKSRNNAIYDIASRDAGFVGKSRAVSSSFIGRGGGLQSTFTSTSQTPAAEDLCVFRFGTTGTFSSARISFYSIGESLDLELLDARVTRLMNLITYTQTPGLPDLSVMDIDAAAYIGGGYRAGGTLS